MSVIDLPMLKTENKPNNLRLADDPIDLTETLVVALSKSSRFDFSPHPIERELLAVKLWEERTGITLGVYPHNKPMCASTTGCDTGTSTWGMESGDRDSTGDDGD